MSKFKYLVVISYDGSKFFGWNKQPNLTTVASSIEEQLKPLFNKNFKLTASGRTDRYVHALNQVFSIDGIEYQKEKVLEIKKMLNQIDGLTVKKISKVEAGFSPRFNAKQKVYLYKLQINPKKAKSTKINYEYQYPYKIDLLTLKADAKYLIGKRNFASFTAKQIYHNYEREVLEIKIYQKRNYLYFEITGTGFMRYMVRNLVGTLLAKNRGKYSHEQFIDLLEHPSKGKAHYKAPGSGLYLKKVIYK